MMLAFFLLIVIVGPSHENAARISPVVITGENNGACPSDGNLNAQKLTVQEEIRDILIDHSYDCGVPGWTRIAYLNMSDPYQQCPPNWNLTTTPVRGCGRSSTAGDTCDSAIFSSTGVSYSHVYGRVIAYQHGTPSAFDPSLRGYFANNPNPGLEGAYVDGVSLTHGAAGSRQHIWTFAAALYESTSNPLRFFSGAVCACTNTNFNWPYQVPSFIGNDYFCDTANRGPDFVHGTFYPDDPLWDGKGCGPTSTCCEFNNPPFFNITLPQATTDNIELRVCHDQSLNDEDTVISLVDICVR